MKKAFYTNNAPVMYLFVLHRLARKFNVQSGFITRAETLYDSLKTPCFATFSLPLLFFARSLLLWSIESHDVDLSVFCLLLYL